jgi:hypothetical protein
MSLRRTGDRRPGASTAGTALAAVGPDPATAAFGPAGPFSPASDGLRAPRGGGWPSWLRGRGPAPLEVAPCLVTPRELEREARTILERLRRLDRLDTAEGEATPWTPEAVDSIVLVLAEFHRRLEATVREDHDPTALPHVLATRRCVAQAQLIVLGRLASLCAD